MALIPFTGIQPNGRALYYGDAPPSLATDGNFIAGDIVMYAAVAGETPAVGTPIGWICTGSGTGATSAWSAFSGQSAVHATITAATYTAVATDNFLPVDTTANAVQITLPAAATVKGQSFAFSLKKPGANNLTVIVAGAGAIGSGTTLTLSTNNAGATVRSDGTQYWVISSFGTVAIS